MATPSDDSFSSKAVLLCGNPKRLTISLGHLQEVYQDINRTPAAIRDFLKAPDGGLFVCSYLDLIRFTNLIKQRFESLPENLSLWLQGVEEGGLFDETLRKLVGALVSSASIRVGILSSSRTFLPSVIPESAYPAFELSTIEARNRLSP